MTRRIAAVFLLLVAGVLVAVGVPLALSHAETRTQALVLDRDADAARLAQLAAPAFARDAVDSLAPEVRAYSELYGVRVEVYDRDGAVVLSSQPGAAPSAPAGALGAALAGQRSASSPRLVPWGAPTVVVAEPVLRGTQVAGAVVTTSPTDEVRSEVLGYWLLLAGVGVGTLVVSALVTVPLSRWVLRPVRRLDVAVHTLTRGDLTTHVDPGHGPLELRRLLEHFNHMAGALRVSSAQQRALVADASHQLRNPLTALRLRVEALETVVPEHGREQHGLAVQELERLTEVLDDTLALARAQDGSSEPVAVDVSACARGRLQVWSDAAAHVDTVMLLHAGQPAWVLAPAGALEQVFDAVLHNALRFAAGGTVTVDVLLGQDGSPGTVRVCISDDGPGLSEEQCAEATRRFWRGADQQNVPGSGLGLAIAGTLVERCGGTLTVAPARPHGLQVALTLPGLARQPLPTPGLAER